MLRLKNIKKSYNEKVVLRGVNLELESGQVYGLIGANGAGKTTLLNIIAGVASKNDGTVEIDNHVINNLNDIKGRIGYVLDIPAMFEYLTASEYLHFLMSALNFTEDEKNLKTEQLLLAVGLEDAKNQKIRNFSRGMKQRMGIAAGLVANPPIVLLDEPSSALDPQGRAEVMEIINELKNQGKTILLSTHILSDVERICDKIGLLIDGRIEIEGNLNEVMERYSKPILCVESAEVEKLKTFVKNLDGCRAVYDIAGGIEIEIDADKKQQIFKDIVNSEIEISGIYTKKASVEEIFLNVRKGGQM